MAEVGEELGCTSLLSTTLDTLLLVETEAPLVSAVRAVLGELAVPTETADSPPLSAAGDGSVIVAAASRATSAMSDSTTIFANRCIARHV